MSNVRQLPNHNAIIEEASLWLSRIDRDLSPQEKTELQLWASNKEHRKTLLTMAELWDSMSTLSELSALFPLEDQTEPPQKKMHRMHIAASLLLICWAIGLAGYWLRNDTQTELTVFATEIGEQERISLSDGSIIHLNTNSQIRVEYIKSQRNIYLVKGEAHFKVAHNKNRPFTVHAKQHSITAVGTAFNVQLHHDIQGVEVLVTEGKVTLDNPPPSIDSPSQANPEPAQLLVAGEKLALSNETPGTVESIESSAVDNQLAWQRGFLIFDGEPLKQVMQEVGRYTDLRFKVDQNIEHVQIAGYFKTDDVDALLHALEENFDIESERSDQDIKLMRPSH